MRVSWLTFLFLLQASVSNAQNFSNQGKEFWIGYGNHQVMYFNNNQGMDLYFTADESTTARVEIPGIGFSTTVQVIANQISSVTIPQGATLSEEGKSKKGIHVVAEKPVVVYAHIYYQAVSGATLCLPVSTLGREYYSINFTQYAQPRLTDSYSYFFVVATEDNTTVEITPTANTVGGKPGGTAFTETLQKGEIYQVLSTTDLTGSIVRSVDNGDGCKRIAVFSGAGRIGIGCGNSVTTSDNLFQQVYPVNTWGKRYITVPSLTRPRNFYRIIRPDASTTVKVNGSVVPPGAFTNDFYYEFESINSNLIEADKPIMVAQYFTTQACGEQTGNGDPEMIYLNPVEQTIRDVTLTSMRLISQQANHHYINIVLPNVPGATGSLRIDGVSVGGFLPVPSDPAYAYVQYETGLGTHRITCDSGFNAIAYGFGSAESYGYSAGTNLRDLNQFLQVRNQFATVDFPAGCKNSPFRLSVVLPYQALALDWQFQGLLNDTTLQVPVADSSWVANGKTFYRYTLERSYSVPTAGTYPLKIIAQNATADGCSGKQEIDYELQIYEQPQASMRVDYSGCASDSVKFTDITSGLNGRMIKDWKWDLGDGSTALEKTFSHRYSNGGRYEVDLTVITDVGCISEPTSSVVELENIPVASFEYGLACEGQEMVLKDRSDPNGGTISKWYWDFGDGQRDSALVADPLMHVYTKGQYDVRLWLRNSKGCISDSFSSTIVVNEVPRAGIGLPEVCLNDAFAAFRDSSSIGDGSTLTYLWDFGDGGQSEDRDPRHRYGASGIYPVVQVVTSGAGCRDTARADFTVNGAVPKAKFSIVNADALCSNRAVSLVNNSDVDFGNVTRLEINWDLDNISTSSFVDEDPSAGKTYSYQYPSFGDPASKRVRIRVVAYSGETCFDEMIGEIELLGSPQLEFGTLDALCANAAEMPLTQAAETSGLAGTGYYSGSGIIGSNQFSPSAARPGDHSISYVFNSQAGCSDTAVQLIRVHQIPIVDAGPDRSVLSGGYVRLLAVASGPGIRWSWGPVSGMDDATAMQPNVSPSSDITYTLTVSTPEGCTVSDDVFVKYLPDIKVPNTFTPNGDGYNDLWEIRSLDTYPGSILEVYNTTGQLLYRTQGYARPWDGTASGRAVPAGTYYYVIDPKNGRKKIAGYVTLIR